MSDFIPLSVPSIQGNEWKYVKECLDTEWVSSAGKYVDKFESDFSQYTGAAHSVACASGTAALQVALRLMGVGPGDEVIVPTVTFIAPVNTITYMNAHPVFMDCDDFYNLDILKTIEFLKTQTEFKNGFSYNKNSGRRISAIIPVHVFGNAVDLEKLIPVCKEKNIKIIEDATESLGTRYTAGAFAGKHAGCIGDIGCFSFNGNKIITTGGGGMIVTNDAAAAQKAKYWTTQAKDDEVRFIHDEIGYNFRMTNVQAAIGVAQLEQMPKYLQVKKQNFLHYREAIKNISGLSIADVPAYAENNLWMYALRIDENIYKESREELMARLQSARIQTRPLWYLNHLQKPYVHCESFKIEKAAVLLNQTLNIPCSVNLDAVGVDRVARELRHE